MEALSQEPEIIETLATIYQDLGRYEDALEQFKLCLRLCKDQLYDEYYETFVEAKIAELKELMK